MAASLALSWSLPAAQPAVHESHSQPQSPQELLVSAAVSLRDALVQIAADFERTHPGQKVRFNFASSGELARQLELGGTSDLFISASEVHMQKLEKSRLVDPADVGILARNQLTVVVPEGSRTVSSLKELQECPNVAIGDPQLVPAGTYAREAMQTAGVYEPLQRDHKLVFAESARQVLQYVESANVDAAIVYRTDAATGKHIRRCLDLPLSLTGPIVYPVAVLAHSANRKQAHALMQFMLGERSQRMLRARGFLPAP